jgi:L-lysine 6-oxidase
MACPWQADFFNCTVQYINFTDPEINKGDVTISEHVKSTSNWYGNDPVNDNNQDVLVSTFDGFIHETTERMPLTPTYYSYWWPAQSLWDVLTGDFKKADGNTVAQMQSQTKHIRTHCPLVTYVVMACG